MNKTQFAEELLKLKIKQNAKSVQKSAIDARKIKTEDQEYVETLQRIIDNFFAGKAEITFEEVSKLKSKMTEDLWNYEFFTYNPDESNTISLKDWMQSIVVCMTGGKIERYLKRIKKVSKHFDENERVTLKQYLAFQYFLQNVDILKNKVVQYRYMDYEMFETIIQAFNKDNDYCRSNRTKVSDVQAKALFLLLDVDGSGELEQEEVMEVLIDKQLLG